MLRPQRSWFGLLAVGLSLTAGSGCSAIVARTRINSAMNAVNTAASAGADKRAPYEYAQAQLYLEKAREEEAYARFGPAIDLSDESAQYAEQARAMAAGEKPNPNPPKP